MNRNNENMKTYFFTFIIALSFSAACSSSDGSKNKSVASDTTTSVQPATNMENTVSDGKPVILSKESFLAQIMDYEKNPDEWVYKGTLPGIIDFYADWCRPCKVTSPILDELAKEYNGKIIVYKVNIDKEQELASVFGVQSIPTFLFMPMKGNPSMSSGIAQTPELTKEMFVKQIEQMLLVK